MDWALACAFVAAGLVEVWVPLESATGDAPPVISTIGITLFGLALTQRRARPKLALLALPLWPLLFVVTGTQPVLFFGQLLPLLLLTFSTARHAPRPWMWIGSGAIAGLVLLADFALGWLQAPEELLFHWSALIASWLAGRGLRASTERAAAAARHAAEVEGASRERTLRALAEERARIARELHDVVAHAVSVIVVQAGAAEQVVDDDPEHVRRALGTIRTTGTGALAEMRRVVTMLRVDDGADRRPQPGLDAVAELVEQAGTGALRVELEVDGAERALPAGVGLAGYRIVQEALTNVRRHSQASLATVRLRYEQDRVEIEVVDNGRGGTTDEPHEPGHGLLGMRERVALYGGELETAGTASGYTVRAVLPVAS